MLRDVRALDDLNGFVTLVEEPRKLAPTLVEDSTDAAIHLVHDLDAVRAAHDARLEPQDDLSRRSRPTPAEDPLTLVLSSASIAEPAAAPRTPMNANGMR